MKNFRIGDLPYGIIAPKNLKMKLTYIFLLVSLFTVNASTYSQKNRMSLHVENVALEKVFSEIEKRTEFRFLYNHLNVDISQKVTINAQDEMLSDILDQIFTGLNLNFKIKKKLIVVKKGPGIEPKPVAPNRKPTNTKYQSTISGTVKDEAGLPLPGANVVEKGTTNGTQTDFDGKFTIQVRNENAILSISYIGFETKEIELSGQSQINVVLNEQTAGLDEVVIVGFGTQKKENLTGAVSVINGKDLVNRPAVGTLDALQGSLPGVTITKSSGSPGDEQFNLQIRGVTSINNNPVLVLIDGIEGSMNDVRPEDIESISVLKDAAASSIYGAKAAGGVVLVTTKGGQEGKVQINYNTYYSVSKMARLPERLNSYEIAEALNVATVNASGNPVVSQDIIDKLRNPNILYEIDPNNPNQYLYYGNYDDVDIALRDVSSLVSHNLSVSGGSEKILYRVSGTYYENSGLLKIGYDNNEQYTGRLNLDTKINKNITLSNNISYAKNIIQKPAGTNRLTQSGNGLESRNALFSDLFQSPGVSPLYDPNGFFTYGNRIGPFDARNRLLNHIYDIGLDERNQNNFRLNSKLTWDDILPGFRARAIGVVDSNFNNSFVQEKPIYEYDVNGTREDNPAIPDNSLYKDQTKATFKEFQALLDYEKSIGDHNLYLLGGYSFQDFRREFTSEQVQGLINENLASLNWASNEGIILGDQVLTNAFQSVFGRLTYNYKERYLLETNVRYDGSSKLSPSDRYKFFPSASLAWRISKESWFDVPFISQLKFRGSIGKLGNAGVLGNYGFISTLNTNDQLILSADEQRARYVFQNQLASEELSWETIETSNLGIDIGLFKNRLNIVGDYYVKKNIDMLAPVSYPSVLGVGVNVTNAGELRTWGWELGVTWKDSNSKDFNYWINANLSDNQNELVTYLGAENITPGTNPFIEGLPINTIWGYRTDGLFQSETEVENYAFQNGRTGAGDLKYLDLNGDGRINSGEQSKEDHGDLVNLGDTNPRYNFGFQAGFKLKDIDFMVFFQGVGKRNFIMDEFAIMPYFRPWLHPQRHHLDYWSEENTDAFWPRLYARGDHNYLPSDKWVQNAAYLRLKDIQIGYSLPESVLDKIGISQLRIYVSGRDVWETTKTFDFIDPEMPNGATFIYPFNRKFTLGLNLTF